MLGLSASQCGIIDVVHPGVLGFHKNQDLSFFVQSTKLGNVGIGPSCWPNFETDDWLLGQLLLEHLPDQ